MTEDTFRRTLLAAAFLLLGVGSVYVYSVFLDLFPGTRGNPSPWEPVQRIVLLVMVLAGLALPVVAATREKMGRWLVGMMLIYWACFCGGFAAALGGILGVRF